MYTIRIRLLSLLFTLLIIGFFSDISAMTVKADSLVQPDTTSIKKDTTTHGNKSSVETISEDFGNRLKSQLNLTDKQTGIVKSIIASYAENYNESMSNPPAGQEIEKILNDTQRSSWQSVQSGFWSDLNKRIENTKKKIE